jgi:peptidoglycan hydrolase FlgJ
MASSPHISGSLAANAQSLDQLRAQARQSPEQALKATAQQFESVFMNMMLKSMRDATPQDGMFDNEQTKMFTGMLDQQLVQNMSSRGIGLADIMVKQLSRTGASSATPAPLAPNTVPGTTGTARNWQPVFAPSTATASPAVADAPPDETNPSGDSLPSAYSANFQQDFVQRLTPYALQASRETGVPAQLMMGQAALESGWGRREIRLPDGSNSYNLFGIKAGPSWNGKVAEVTTTEYRNGIPVKQVEKFRAYNSYAEAFSDYARLLRDNPRYAPVVKEGQTAPAAAHALQRAGYATDPNYAVKLVKVMSRINTLG